MTINVDLLTRTLAQIEAHPELWDQSMWLTERSCGTAYCFAGWAVVLHGATFARDRDGDVDEYHVVPPGGGGQYWIADYAAQILGINHTRGHGSVPPLFADLNSLDTLRRIVGELVAEAGATA